MPDELLLGAALGLVFLAGFFAVRPFFAGEAEARARKALGVEEKPRVYRSVLHKWSRPFYLRLTPLVEGAMPAEWRRKRAREIVAAGMSGEIDPAELWAYQTWLALVALGLLALFVSEPAWWAWPLAAALGFWFPGRWLKDRVRLRQGQILRALPDVVDMLALSVEAGLDFMAAIGKVTQKSRPGPLVEELKTMLGEVRMGASRADGLRNLAQRCDVAALSAFVAVLVQADRLGVSIGQVLRAQADKMRADRFQRAERLGAQASQKILFPLILCIMPAVFIVILGPLLLRYALGL